MPVGHTVAEQICLWMHVSGITKLKTRHKQAPPTKLGRAERPGPGSAEARRMESSLGSTAGTRHCLQGHRLLWGHSVGSGGTRRDAAKERPWAGGAQLPEQPSLNTQGSPAFPELCMGKSFIFLSLPRHVLSLNFYVRNPS